MSRHCIGTLRLVVKGARPHEGDEVQQQLLRVARRALPDLLERLFDEAGPPRGRVRLDVLHVPLGRCPRLCLRTRLLEADRYGEALRNAMREPPVPADASHVVEADVVQDAAECLLHDLLHYLRFGDLPWGSGLPGREIAAGLRSLWANGPYRARLESLIRVDGAAAARAAALRGKPVSLERILALPMEPHSGPRAVDNAGLTLFAPLLPDMFRQAELLAEQDFSDENTRLRGVFLLQRLVSDDVPPESELALNKFLCGWPLERPLPAPPALLPRELAPAREAVHALSRHWPPFSGASRDDLARLFIRRRGVLHPGPSPLLRVAPEGQDVLFSRLPWSEREIRLPWSRLQVVWHA